MMRVWGHVLAGSSLVAATCAVFVACTHDDSSLFVRGVLAQQLVTTGQQCTYTSDPTQPVISDGTLDVALRPEYDAMMLIGNQLVAESNSAQLQTETSIVNIQGAIVRITDSSGGQLASFTYPTAVTVSPGSGGTPGYQALSAVLLDSKTASSVAPTNGGSTTVISNVRVYGKTLGGQSVESDEFAFPISVCNGCLLKVSQSDVNPACPYPNCFGASASGGGSGTQMPVPCNIGQDIEVDCSQCLGVAAACSLGAPAGATAASCLLLDAGGGG